ncbi:MAG: xylulokinase [Halioglobus sp.]|nr:xylulokinase [Halioglobus sp.]
MYLGIDIGTQSVKTLLYDLDRATVHATSSEPLPLRSDRDGTREQEASWWIVALEACVARLPGAGRRAVRAVAVSGQQHGLVPLGSEDEVLAPVKLWCDTTTDQQCDEITRAFGGRKHCITSVGNAILPGYTASKIRWLKQHRPAAYDALATVLLPHDYINLWLTGERVMEYGDASGTGLLDIRKREWHSKMLQAVDADRSLADVMPPLVGAESPIGRLRKSVAEQLGLPGNVPVSSGGGDNMMTAIGTGTVVAGRMTASLGTSATLFASAQQAVIDTAGDIAAFCSSTGDWLPLLCTMNCTVATELTRRTLNMSLEEMEAAVAAAPVGAGGVVTVPFFNGERTPDLPRGKGCVLGLDDSNYSSGNLLRSAMESSIYGLRYGLDAFSRNHCSVDSLRLTGGGSSSAVWRQMVADILNLPVTVQTCNEGAALGAALQAAWVDSGDGLVDLLDAQLSVDEPRCCLPSTQRTAAYSEHYDNYRRQAEVVMRLYL